MFCDEIKDISVKLIIFILSFTPLKSLGNPGFKASASMVGEFALFKNSDIVFAGTRLNGKCS